MKHLTRDHTYTLSMTLENHYSKYDLTRWHKVDKSIISFEIKNNCEKRDGTFRYEVTEWKRLIYNRNKRSKSIINKQVKRIIVWLLRKKLIHEQISAKLKLMWIISISYQTIYMYIWKNNGKKEKI